MANPKQKNGAKAIILNELSSNPKTLGEVLQSETVRYTKLTAEAPSRVIERQGFQEELEAQKKTMIGALERIGVNPIKVAKKIDALLNAEKKVRTYTKGDLTSEYEEEDHQAIDKGITHALKIGVGGGYAGEGILSKPELHIHFHKHDEIKGKYEKELEEALKNDK